MLLLAAPLFADPPLPEDVLRPRDDVKENFFIEVGLGVNFSTMGGAFRDPETVSTTDLRESDGSPFTTGSGLAPLLTISPTYTIVPDLQLMARFDFDMRQVANSKTVQDVCTRTNQQVPVRKDFCVQAVYYGYSVLLRYYISDLFVFGGLTYGIAQSQSVTTEQEIDPAANCTYFTNTSAQTKQISGTTVTEIVGGMNLVDRLSLKLGLGYTFKINDKVSLLPQLNYDLGVTNVFATQDVVRLTPDDNDELANIAYVTRDDLSLNSFQFLVGVRYNLGLEL